MVGIKQNTQVEAIKAKKTTCGLWRTYKAEKLGCVVEWAIAGKVFA